MDLLSVALIGISLAMDALAVSICKGLAMRTPSLKSMLVVGLWFGSFQAIMPVIGYYLGESFYQYISEYDHWIAFILLLLIGLNMIRESFLSEDEGMDDSIGIRIMFLLAVATSIDAFAVGITLAMDGSDIWLPALIIGIITLAISMAGVRVGSVVGERFGRKAELVGGLILIMIGLKILLEHLGFL